MYKYPSINQFRNAIHNVRERAQFLGRDAHGNAMFDRTAELPTLLYRGTVKLHGTNASFVYDCATDDVTFQSRERVLTLEQDNAGFMLYMSQSEIKDYLYEFADMLNIKTGKLAVYGEWCGSGIQKNVAVSALPKMFVIFGIKHIDGDTTTWLPFEQLSDWISIIWNEKNIYSIYQFPTYLVEIDFNYPQHAQNQMIAITEAVETECPVGALLLKNYISNKCTVNENYTLNWNDPSIKELSIYSDLEKNIVQFIKQNNITIGSVIEIGV